MPDLQAAVEDWLANMAEPEFRTLVARVRPPDEPILPTGVTTND